MQVLLCAAPFLSYTCFAFGFLRVYECVSPWLFASATAYCLVRQNHFQFLSLSHYSLTQEKITLPTFLLLIDVIVCLSFALLTFYVFHCVTKISSTYYTRKQTRK